MEHKYFILGIRATNRLTQSGKVQEILTEFGCQIKTRLGLHHVSESDCPIHGLILLELCGCDGKCDELVQKLSEIEGLDVQKMIFD